MSPRKITAQELIRKAGELFRKNGYHNTSISDIAKHCGLSKASVYHHIASKQELGEKTILQYHQTVKDEIFSIAYENTPDAGTRLQQFISTMEDHYAALDGACLMGSFTLETAHSTDNFNTLIQAFFNDWVAALAHLLTARFDTALARELAEDAVALSEGALMLYQVNQDWTHFKRINVKLIELLNPEGLPATANQTEKTAA